jgi:predicted nucleic acid-binding protein
MSVMSSVKDFREATAICDTGPLISAFQSESTRILALLFAALVAPGAVRDELEDHGWGRQWAELEADKRFWIVRPQVISPSPRLQELAESLAGRVAQKSRQPNPDAHIGEAQVIALAMRGRYRERHTGVELPNVALLDERAAREVALEEGLIVTGFPGVLLAATQAGIIKPDDLESRLKRCQALGTHYSNELVAQVVEAARRGIENEQPGTRA